MLNNIIRVQVYIMILPLSQSWIKRSLDDQYYCIIILYNIIDAIFKQWKTDVNIVSR